VVGGLIFAALSNNMDVAYSEIVSHVSAEVVRQMEARNPPLATNDVLRLRRINGTLVQGTIREVKDDGLVMAVGTNSIFVRFAELDVATRTRCDPAFRELLVRSIITERAFGLAAGFKPPAITTLKQDAWETMALLKSMASDGLAEAQTWLGLALLEDRKTEEGIGWLKKSAEGGSSEGQYALGQAYFKGLGLPVDKNESFRLFKLAADQGHAEAMLEAGRMLMAGDGCERNVAEGLDLIRRSADALESKAILFMGRFNYGDKRGMRDAAQAFAWFRLGAVLGMSESQYWLGRMYYEGKGVPKDNNRAIQWLTESADQGYGPAADLLDSDAYQKEEMAKARQAYQQELARHSGRLEEIRINPKYDRVNFSRTPSFFGGPEEKAAYQRFTENYFKGRFGSNIAKCADDAWRYAGSGRNYGRNASSGNIVNLGMGSDGIYDGVGPTGRQYISRDGRTWTANMDYRRPSGWSSSYGNEFNRTMYENWLEGVQGRSMGF
jgi:TPR repeat protein